MTLEDWASQWAPKIWSLLHRAAGARQALSDEFLEIVTESRSTLVRALKAGEALETNYLFIERWLKRYGRIRWDLGRWAHYSQLPLLDRLLWSAVFSENWNCQDVLLSFRLTPAALSFRLFRIWTRLSGLAPDRLLATDRMCVRHDLYFIDHHMGWEVSDPAGVLDRLQLQEHRRHCSRCQTLAHELQETMKKFQELDSKVPAYPLEEFRQAWHVPHPLKPRHWPWWVQVPVQVSLVVAAVMGVLSVPYVGELWPLVSRWATPTAERMAETGLEKPETQRNPPSPVVDEAKTSISEVATLTNPVEKSV
jgi:hypothetical protein